jgi:hypothetical protein
MKNLDEILRRYLSMTVINNSYLLPSLSEREGQGEFLLNMLP